MALPGSRPIVTATYEHALSYRKRLVVLPLPPGPRVIGSEVEVTALVVLEDKITPVTWDDRA